MLSTTQHDGRVITARPKLKSIHGRPNDPGINTMTKTEAQSALDAANSNLDSAKAALQTAEETVAQAQTDFDNATEDSE